MAAIVHSVEYHVNQGGMPSFGKNGMFRRTIFFSGVMLTMRFPRLLSVGLILALVVVSVFAGSTEARTRWIAIATGTTGGVYYPYGGALAELWNRHVPNVDATAEATGASVENLRLIQRGESDVALVQGDVAYDAYHGRDRFQGAPIRTRVLMVLYPNVYHAVSLKSIHDRLGLNSFRDVAGHRFSVGAPGSGNEHATSLVFQALGMSFDDIVVQRFAYTETARALRDNQLDAGSWVVGLGHASLQELDATHPIHLIPISDEEQEVVVNTYPFYTPFTIPAGTYSSVQEDVETIALWNVLVAGEDFPEDLAYELVKAAYENKSMLDAAYAPGAPYNTLENLVNSPIPLHPGVIRYAEEQGVAIPDHLRP